MRIEEFIARSNAATTVEELWECLEIYMGQMGFDRVLFSLFTEHKTVCQPAGHGIIRNYPEHWMKHYAEHEYEAIDPVRDFVSAAQGTFVWEELPAILELTKKQQRCLDQGRESGLYDGIAVPLRGSHGALAGLGAASSDPGVDLDPDTLSKVFLVAQQFYTVWHSLQREDGDQVKAVFLTEREREILNWSAKGKSNYDISEILSISESTVDFHMRNVLKKLECNHRVVATLKALHMGLIQP